MSGNKVGMEVCQKEVADLEIKSLRVRHVLFDIALGIDDDRSRAGLVPTGRRHGLSNPDITV
jgi:hypothetical protein